MFSNSAGRAATLARTVTATSTTAANGSTIAARSCIAARSAGQGHQRRLSSSKASVPPNEDEGKRIASGTSKAPASKAPKTVKTTPAATRKARSKRSTSQSSQISSQAWSAAVKEKPQLPLGKLYPGLPEPVRATGFLKREDVAMMQLFAGHLPISPHSVLPPTATDAQFNAIFIPKPSWMKYKDTIDNLNGVVNTLDSLTAMSSSSGGNDLLSSEEPTIHLDASSHPAVMQDPLAEYYKSNRPPPPPRPIEDFGTETKVVRKRSERKGKSWQTTITVTEWTDGQGRRTFAADSTPIVRVPQILQKIIEEPAQRQSSIRQPFLERMRIRQQRFQDGSSRKVIRSPLGKQPKMLLISVKRQRKAKMKKHKLKKLRKRTRNLKRKLGKL